MKAWRMGDNTWQKEGSDRVLQVAGKKPLHEYINRRQEMVAEWVSLRPIFKVCVKETGYKVGVRFREQWWRHTAAERQLKTMLKYISEAAWEQQ